MSDPILLWNQIALEANRVSHTLVTDTGVDEQTGPVRSARALAIVHLAMYDAYAGVDVAAGLPPYLPGLPVPAAGAAVEQAVAAAAHETLSSLHPSQRPFFDLMLASASADDPTDPGVIFGRAVGQAILADRAADPSASGAGYTPASGRGKHRVDADNPSQGYHGPFYGKNSKGFGITQRFELAAPPFDDEEYRIALRSVRGRGVAPELMGTLPAGIESRTTDQSVIGVYWGYDGAAELGTPPRLYNQIVREVAMSKPNPATGLPNDAAQNARLLAFVNVAMADAGILAWDQKYIHELWRPVLGLREHDPSMGPAAMMGDDDISNDCDSGWLPLGAPRSNRAGKNFTPPFPAYPSGHATFGAAAFHITRLFYGIPVGDRARDNLFAGLAFVSDELNGATRDNKGAVRPRHLRRFRDGLWQMIEENGRSRVYLGVHWVFDAFTVDEEDVPLLDRTDANGRLYGGVPFGLQIAEDIYQAGGTIAPLKSTVGPRP